MGVCPDTCADMRTGMHIDLCTDMRYRPKRVAPSLCLRRTTRMWLSAFFFNISEHADGERRGPVPV